MHFGFIYCYVNIKIFNFNESLTLTNKILIFYVTKCIFFLFE